MCWASPRRAEHRLVPLGGLVPAHLSVLASAAIEGKVDELRGLKESVIIACNPAGTGFRARRQERPTKEDEAWCSRH